MKVAHNLGRVCVMQVNILFLAHFLVNCGDVNVFLVRFFSLNLPSSSGPAVGRYLIEQPSHVSAFFLRMCARGEEETDSHIQMTRVSAVFSVSFTFFLVSLSSV